MKNIVVVGPPRIGKTTFSKIVVKEVPCYNVINVDVIRESIYKSMCTDMEKHERKKYVKNIFPEFLKTMLKQYISYYNPDLYYIIEGDLLSLKEAIDIKKEYDIEIVCIGVPNINNIDLFNRIRKNASVHGCWTSKHDDKTLMDLCEKIIKQSKEEFNICKENNLTYLDNSKKNKCLYGYVKSINTITQRNTM